MEFPTSLGGLVPLWIIGVPWLVALYALATTPMPSHRPLSERRFDAPAGGVALGSR